MLYLASVPVVPDPGPGFDFFDFSDPGNVVLLVGFLIPIITGVIVKKVAHSGIKAVSTMVLSILTATVATLVGLDGEWAWRAFGNAFLSAFLPAIALYYGFLKPAGVTGKVQDMTANFGILGRERSTVPVVAHSEHAVNPPKDAPDSTVVADVRPDRSLIQDDSISADRLGSGDTGARPAPGKGEGEDNSFRHARPSPKEEPPRFGRPVDPPQG